jgi:hypothetical protein
MLLVMAVTGFLVISLHLSLEFYDVDLQMTQFSFGSRLLASKLCAVPYGTKHEPSSKSGLARPFTRRIIAVGDLHGDMQNAKRVLQFSGVVDKYGDWTGRTDFFVQTGDIIDR